jgi:hypothetical protein
LLISEYFESIDEEISIEEREEVHEEKQDGLL